MKPKKTIILKNQNLITYLMIAYFKKYPTNLNIIFFALKNINILYGLNLNLFNDENEIYSTPSLKSIKKNLEGYY